MNASTDDWTPSRPRRPAITSDTAVSSIGRRNRYRSTASSAVNDRTSALRPRPRTSSPSATSICTAARTVGRATPNSADSSVSRSCSPPR